MKRRERWIQIIDANLDYLFRHQEPDGRSNGEPVPSRGTAQLAHAALWAYRQPASRHAGNEQALASALKAIDLLVQKSDGWKTCPFTPSYFGEALLLLEQIEQRQNDPCRETLSRALGFQRETGNHTPGHFADWDILFALSLAIGSRIFGSADMMKAAAEHAHLVQASVVPGGDGFFYLISPYQYWPPSVNYTGISTSSFARYYELSGDSRALEMIRTMKDYFLYFTEPSGLTEFTTSPWHKHPTDTKEDTFSFVAASTEFLSPATGDRRLDSVSENMLRNLEFMLAPDGTLRRRFWDCAWINRTAYDPNTTGYLVYAAQWCQDGVAEPLPDSFISERRGINAFKARRGNFGYSVVCGESYTSLCGAWVGRESVLQEVTALVADWEGTVFGQMAPLWRKNVTRFPEGFAQTAYYQPAQIIGDSWGARYANWRVYQTYVGTTSSLLGIISLESLADQEGRFACVDLHLGPAGQKVWFGFGRVQGEAFVSTDNPEPVALARLAPDSWIHYGQMGIILREVSGQGMEVTCWDGVAQEGVLHASEFSSVISNDLVISCATPEGPQSFAKGQRYSLIFAALPVPAGRDPLSFLGSGPATILPRGSALSSAGGSLVSLAENELQSTFGVAIDQGDRVLIVLAAHHPMVKPIRLRHSVPQGDYRVTVYAEARGLPLKEFAFSGQDFEVEVATVSPAVVVEMTRLHGAAPECRDMSRRAPVTIFPSRDTAMSPPRRPQASAPRRR